MVRTLVREILAAPLSAVADGPVALRPTLTSGWPPTPSDWVWGPSRLRRDGFFSSERPGKNNRRFKYT